MKFAVSPHYQSVLTEKVTEWLGEDPPEEAVKAVEAELERLVPLLRDAIQGATGEQIPAECPPCPADMRCIGAVCIPNSLVKLAD